MIKEWRLLILLFCVAGAIFSIILKPQYQGVEIIYVEKSSPARDVLKQGMIVTSVNGEVVRNVDDWNRAMRKVKKNLTIVADKRTYHFLLNDSSNVGISVMDVSRTNLDFGLDIRGGTRIILSPGKNASKNLVEQVVATLQTRANVYGLKEIKFIPVRNVDGRYYIQVEAAGIGRSIVDELLSRQGKFEAKVLKPVFLEGNSGKFIVGENEYSVTYGNDTLRIGNITVRVNDTFVLDGIKFKYVNKSSNELFFLATVYTGNDIELVYTDPQHSGVIPTKGGYRFYFVTLISKKGAERFAKVTSGIPSQMDIYSGEYYLKDSRIILFIDEKPVSDLRISSTLGGKVYTTPQVEGFRESMENAIKEKLRLQSILRSGALPVKLETVSVGVVSPTLGDNFLSSVGMAALVAAVSIVIVVYLRYRSFKFSLPMAMMSAFEALIILGISAANDSLVWATVLVLNTIVIILAMTRKEEVDVTAWIGAFLIPVLGMTFSWTIDMPAITGIIAAIGTGVDNMVIIADETMRKGEEKKIIYTLKEKVKMAFFIIFGTASTTISAMFPLMIIGIGLIRGFAITTVIGVLVGVLITRPAYVRIIERINK